MKIPFRPLMQASILGAVLASGSVHAQPAGGPPSGVPGASGGTPAAGDLPPGHGGTPPGQRRGDPRPGPRPDLPRAPAPSSAPSPGDAPLPDPTDLPEPPTPPTPNLPG